MTPDECPSIQIALDGVAVEAGGRMLLDVPRLRIAAGERVALVGPNGAGKSTLLRLLTGFARPARGTVRVLGRSFGPAGLAASQWRRLRREIGLVSQGLHLVPRLTARENVLIGALRRSPQLPAWRSWTRLFPPALIDEADAALAFHDLQHRAGTRADRLSGGERQKVALARLLLQRPLIVLADEPTAALDPGATLRAIQALRQAPADGTLLTVLHDTALLPQLADRVLGLKEGRIAWDLPVAAVGPAALATLYRRDADRPGATPDASLAALPDTVLAI